MTTQGSDYGERPPRRRIVVGVDGSPAALAALAWAHEQAVQIGASLDVVGAWGFPVYIAEPNVWPFDMDIEALVHHQLQASVDRALGPAPAVPVRLVVAQGSPAMVLMEAAEGADLLVVGSRGHGELVDVILGSVSLRCAAHASCPVVIVPAP